MKWICVLLLALVVLAGAACFSEDCDYRIGSIDPSLEVAPVDGFTANSLRITKRKWQGIALPWQETLLDVITVGGRQQVHFAMPEDGNELVQLYLGGFDARDYDGLSIRMSADRGISVALAVVSHDSGLHGAWGPWDVKGTELTCRTIDVGKAPQTYLIPFSAFSDYAGFLEDFPNAIDGINLRRVMAIEFEPEVDRATLKFFEISLYADPAASAETTGDEATAHLPAILEIEGLEAVGSPFLEIYPDSASLTYARTVWDLKAWEGLVYVGAGDSAGNAGPVSVISYDPAQDSFKTEFSVDDEQVEKYRELSDGLYIPGHDAMESWDNGNLYVNRGEGWTKLRTLPSAVHVYDIAEVDGQLVAVGAQIREDDEGYYGGGAFFFSDDGGLTWESQVTLSTHYSGTDVFDPQQPDSVRFTELFEFRGDLYASGWLMPTLYIYEDGRFSYVEIDAFPGVGTGDGVGCGALPHIAAEYVDDLMSDEQWYGAFEEFDPCMTARITNHAVLGEQFVYIGGTLARDHGWEAFGLFAATSFSAGEIRRVRTPTASEEPRDLSADGDLLYLLASEATEDGFVSRIYSTQDLETWEPLVEFTSDAPAYSIEILDGFLYVGLGGDSPSSGSIYRVGL
ncbi:hypothetical protein ACFLR0_01875 [Candidatus Bipolaricaulota bacterium]